MVEGDVLPSALAHHHDPHLLDVHPEMAKGGEPGRSRAERGHAEADEEQDHVGGLERRDGPGLHVVREVEDDLVEMRPKDCETLLDLRGRKRDALRGWRRREYPETARVLRHEALEERLVHPVQVLKGVDDRVCGPEV